MNSAKCDKCGRFFPARQVGSSWTNVPYSDVSSEDMRERCAPCTALHGALMPWQLNMREGVAYGVVNH